MVFSSLLINVLLVITTALLLVLFLVFIKRKYKNNINPFDQLHLKIREDIKFAITPKFIELSMGVNELVDLATEVWRIEQRLRKVTDILPENQKKGLENSVSKLKRFISNYDIEIVDYTNQKFNDGLNLDVLSVEKDSAVVTPTVKETVEPTILVKGQVVKKAKIILVSN